MKEGIDEKEKYMKENKEIKKKEEKEIIDEK